MTKICAWCGNHLFGCETHALVCNDCLSGKTRCDGCGQALRDHRSGEGCPPYGAPDRRTPRNIANSPERWISAYQRAQDENLMIRPGLFGTSLWTVSSRTNPDLVYATDGTICGCLAYIEGNDPVCKHRALYRAVHDQLPGIDDIRDDIFAPDEVAREMPHLGRLIEFRQVDDPKSAA